jgi:dolichol-phosphate mannosyltransferase
LSLTPDTARIDVVMPVHDEGAGIAATLREFHRQAAADGISIRFVVCEDGSTDDTLRVLESLRAELPMLLLHETARRSYSQAVLAGLRASSSAVVAAVDADGQYDPRDLKPLLEALEGRDLARGYRDHRADPWPRLAMSWSFSLFYRFLFPYPAKDPSCPFVLVRRNLLERLLAGGIGVLRQGFWWEFLARAAATSAVMAEVPVRHRARPDGGSRVYRPVLLLGIAWSHALGLLRLRRELGLDRA